jgi:hypothetical protein
MERAAAANDRTATDMPAAARAVSAQERRRAKRASLAPFENEADFACTLPCADLAAHGGWHEY